MLVRVLVRVLVGGDRRSVLAWSGRVLVVTGCSGCVLAGSGDAVRVLVELPASAGGVLT